MGSIPVVVVLKKVLSAVLANTRTSSALVEITFVLVHLCSKLIQEIPLQFPSEPSWIPRLGILLDLLLGHDSLDSQALAKTVFFVRIYRGFRTLLPRMVLDNHFVRVQKLPTYFYQGDFPQPHNSQPRHYAPKPAHQYRHRSVDFP